jgi:hypothetical protein
MDSQSIRVSPLPSQGLHAQKIGPLYRWQNAMTHAQTPGLLANSIAIAIEFQSIEVSV